MKRKMTFNGAVLDDTVPGFKTLSVSGRQFNEADIESSENVTDGATFVSKRIPEKELTVTFMLKPSNVTLKEAQDKLLAALNTSEPQKLIFSDEPQVYFNAMFQEAKVEEEHDKVRSGTLTFVCLDPFKHSTTLKEFTAAVNSDGVLEATITNNGTVDVPISYEITHATENGYIGIVSDKGAMQYGFIEEADGVTYKQNECLLTHTTIFNTADDVGGVDQMHPDDGDKEGTSGSLTMRTNQCTYLGFGTEGTKKGNASGGLRTITIPADSEGVYGAQNFYCWFRVAVYAGLMGQTGEMCINWLTEDNTPICGLNWYKADKSGNTGYYAIYGYTPTRTKHNGNLKCYGTYKYVCDHISNPWYPPKWGQCDLRKEGSKLTFYFMGKYPQVTIPEIENMVCKKIQISIKAMTGRTSVGGNFLNCLGLSEFYFHKMNVEKWNDVPNHYAAGDILTIDGDTRKVYVNGMPKQLEEVRGTTYFKATPGETDVEIRCSSWINTKPTVKAYIREAWL